MSRAQIRSTNSETVFGVLWNVLNPLLLALVYYLLVSVLSGGTRSSDYFAHILGGLFAFYFVTGCMAGGANSVTSAGKIIMNTSFPRILVVLSAVFIAVRKFLPTMIVYFVVAFATHVGVTWTALFAIPMFMLIVVFGTGLALMLATAQVYFRDTSSFLPYVSRIWLYISPVLFYPDASFLQRLGWLNWLNPMYSLLGGWTQLLVRGEQLTAQCWIIAAAWALGSLVLGLWVFLSRERDFAVRL